MRNVVQSIMREAAEVAVRREMGAAGGGGRELYEGEQQRPGRSELAYMQQHKYTPLDSRIIIITAAILLLLLSILFLNFFIRWALRRFFLLHSPKPLNPNKGLSKRQVQSLPSFTYSSSKSPTFNSTHGPCPTFDPPTTCHIDYVLMPISCHDLHPTQFGSPIFDRTNPPSKSKVDVVDHNPPSHLCSTKCVEVDKDPHTKLGSLEVDEMIEDNTPPTIGEGIANDSNSIIGSTMLSIDSQVKAKSPTFKGGDPIISCTETDEMSNHGDDNGSSPATCPICLGDYADGDIIRVLPTCRHYFHIGCIDTWLAKSSSCPACRANILEATRTPIKQSTLEVQVIITTSH